MDDAVIYERLTEVFRDIFDIPDLILKEDTTASDVENWDSIGNMQLLVAIEHEFGIKFTIDIIPSMKSVGGIINAIKSLLGQ